MSGARVLTRNMTVRRKMKEKPMKYYTNGNSTSNQEFEKDVRRGGVEGSGVQMYAHHK